MTDDNWKCTWSEDGMSVSCGPKEPPAPTLAQLSLAAQQLAGEEDQSQPGWDVL
jgi:hypothetical protein